MSPKFYRREAARYRLLAGDETDRAKVEQLRRLAAECDDLAEDMERGDHHMKPPPLLW